MCEVKYDICKKCGKLIKYHEKDTVWDEAYVSCSAKLIQCKECGAYNVLKYELIKSFVEETKEQ